LVLLPIKKKDNLKKGDPALNVEDQKKRSGIRPVTTAIATLKSCLIDMPAYLIVPTAQLNLSTSE
jgi:hypothetical protein